MVVCHYYLRGICRFGSGCWNEHPKGKAESQAVKLNLNLHEATSTSNRVEDLITGIKEEMTVWEKSNIWPFSCFSHEKRARCLSGFLDYSPEEIRLEAYKAIEFGTSDEYEKSVKQLDEQYTKRRAELKSLTQASWELEKQSL